MAATAPDLTERAGLGSRVARIRSSHSYGRVLVLVVASFVFAATAPDADWSASTLLLLEAAALVVALWTAGVARVDSKLSLQLALLAVALAAANLIWTGNGLAAAIGLVTAALSVATAVAIAVGVADQPEVNARSVLGAISIYVLLGMIFLFIYGAVATLGSGAFFAQGTDGTRAIRLYFSYVTLSTVGYGDYSAATNLGHLLAVLEALMGQLYLVTVVALLVSRMRTRRE